VAAPEGANNADASGALVPLLTLGIPGGNTTAILLGGLILWGYKPGPLLIQEHPQMFWGLVASMYIGNAWLLVLNLPLVPLFAQILRLPYYVLYPLIFGISFVGVYSVNNSLFDVSMMGLFGLLGYLMRKLEFPAAALILGMVLGDALERALRQSLMMSQGDITILLTRPISGTLLFIAAVILILPAARKVRSWRYEAIEREG
jgi:putative tricarboxylic transport membrane protein